MKKFTAVMMALIMLLSFAACSKDKVNSQTDASDTTAQQTTEQSIQETTAPVKNEQEEKKLSFKETLVADKDAYSIKVTGIVPDAKEGYEIKLELVNKESEKALNFYIESVFVNSVQAEVFFGEDVSAGKTSKTSFFIEREVFEKNGIKEFTDIELYISVNDAEYWSDEPIALEKANIFPYGEQYKESYHRESSPSDIVIIDNEFAKMTVIGWERGMYGDYNVSFYLENKTAEKELRFVVEGCAVNGVQIGYINGYDVSAGRTTFAEFGIVDETLNENGITEFTDIKFDIGVIESDSWEADYIARESVNIYPEGIDKAVRYEREAKDTDVILADNEYATVIATGFDAENENFASLKLYLVNKTDKALTFSIDSASINDVMLDPFYAQEVGSGNIRFSNVEWEKSMLTDAEITSVDVIDFSLRVYDSESYDEMFIQDCQFRP